MNLPQTQWDLVEGPCPHHCVHTVFLLRFHLVSSTSMKILLRPHRDFTRFFPRFCKVVEEHGTVLLRCCGSYNVHTAFEPGSQWVCNSFLFLFWHFYQILKIKFLIWLSIIIFSSKKTYRNQLLSVYLQYGEEQTITASFIASRTTGHSCISRVTMAQEKTKTMYIVDPYGCVVGSLWRKDCNMTSMTGLWQS